MTDTTAFPPPDIAAALKRPTVQTSDPRGYRYDSTSPEWKWACAPLPSFAALQWPGYSTTCIHTQVRGMDAIIQPWLGHCQKFLGRTAFPGGFGGEVGVYLKVPGGRPLPDLSILPGPLKLLFEAVHLFGADHCWWPDAQLQPEIAFTIKDPKTKAVLFEAEPEKTFWLNKWMQPDSFKQFSAAHPGLPMFTNELLMEFTVDGVTRQWHGSALL